MKKRELGPVQRHVLLVLSTRGSATIPDWNAWYPMREDSVRSAIEGLGRRGLVDAIRMEGRCRVFALTPLGYEAVQNLTEDPADEMNEGH